MKTEQKPIHSGFGETTTADEVIAARNLDGKVVVITGGHSGIGLETTRALSNAGATIAIGARDLTGAREAVSQIKNVEVYELDLAEPVSVDEFAYKCRGSFNRSDILMNNAGIMATPLLRNSQGYELQFATHHLGHFRLTAGLWTELSRCYQSAIKWDGRGLLCQLRHFAVGSGHERTDRRRPSMGC